MCIRDRLGAGACGLPAFLHEALPGATIDAVELSADVCAAATTLTAFGTFWLPRCTPVTHLFTPDTTAGTRPLGVTVRANAVYAAATAPRMVPEVIRSWASTAALQIDVDTRAHGDGRRRAAGRGECRGRRGGAVGRLRHIRQGGHGSLARKDAVAKWRRSRHRFDAMDDLSKRALRKYGYSVRERRRRKPS